MNLSGCTRLWGNLIAETGVDRVILKGDYSGAVKRGAVKRGMEPSRISIDGNPESVADEVCSATGNGDWVLVKGSRGMRMEETIKAIIRLAGTDPGRDSCSKGESV